MQQTKALRKNVNLVNIDELIFDLQCTTATLCAVHSAMTEGPAKAEYWGDALFGVLLSFTRIVNDLAAEIYEEDDNPGGVKTTPAPNDPGEVLE